MEATNDPVITRRSVVVFGLAAAAVAGAQSMTPPDTALPPAPELENNIPKAFGGWKAIASGALVLPDPATQASISAIYDETFSRTYVAADGTGIMLVIAYGARQTDALQAHKPQTCYGAQGFFVEERGSTALDSQYPIPVTQIYATQGSRSEPIVYWMAVGEKVTGFGLALKLQQMREALHRRVPDGFLVRASLLGPDQPQSYKLLNRFLTDMLNSLQPSLRVRLVGL